MPNPNDTVDLAHAYGRALVLHEAIDKNEVYADRARGAGKPDDVYEAKIDRYNAELAALGDWLGRPGFFGSARLWKLKRQFVEHVANIVFSGERVYSADHTVTPAEIRRAYELTDDFDLLSHNLNQEYFEALETAYLNLEA